MPMFATYWATPYPAYPVSWDEGNTHFDITSIHVGMGLIAPGDIHFGDVFDNQGRAYPTGTFFYAIRFAVKTSNKDQSNGTTTLANPRLYRLVDEQGDLVPGNERGGGTTFIIPDNEIIPPTDTIDEYTFTTGGSSNIFFYVKPSNNGSHIIEKEPMSD